MLTVGNRNFKAGLLLRSHARPDCQAWQNYYKGRLHIDEHHTIEDTRCLKVEAFTESFWPLSAAWNAMTALPMDESETKKFSLILAGRDCGWFGIPNLNVKIRMPTRNVFYFAANHSAMQQNVTTIYGYKGENEHHKAKLFFNICQKQ